MTSPEAANKAIRDGMSLYDRQFKTEMLEPDPRRCLKCQKFGVDHMAANCPSMDVCGTCGGEHRTAQCPHREEKQKHQWANCTTDRNHPSWDRNCPELIKRIGK